MANTKISDLTALAAPSDDDVLPIVDDPGGTPVTKKATVSALRTAFSRYLSADPATPADGESWIRASGTSPTRTIEWRVRDNGATYTLAAITV